ncbi:MAG: TetR/AcrR family transcriptional regulator [Solirubrobacteraceae bacterium]
MSNTTRDRIIQAAMRLFSERGYSATSVAKIEAAVGLKPGAGGLYHHFKSKEAVLAAGIELQLERLDTLRDIRSVLTPLEDHTAELSVIACYILAELSGESELLLILTAEARSRPALLTAAVEKLVDFTFNSFAAWIGERAERAIAEEQATAVAALGFGSLLSSHLLCEMLGVPTHVESETLLDVWVKLMASALTED